jgi:hypothetical protein
LHPRSLSAMSDDARSDDPPPGGEHRDALPDDLDAGAFAGAYRFPDNSRRRIAGVIYLVLAAAALAGSYLWEDSVLVNEGWRWAALALAVVGLISLATGVRMNVDERAALVSAQRAVGFPVGHASAQQVWRGLRSRPTWRVLAYSAEDPPRRRGLVLVDAVDGSVVEALVEDNPDL